MRLAASGGITLQPTSQELIYLAIGLVVLFGFIVASRLASRFTGDQLVKRHVRTELVVISRRVVTVIVIGLGLFAAMSFAVESANVALFGLILATIVHQGRRPRHIGRAHGHHRGGPAQGHHAEKRRREHDRRAQLRAVH